VPWRNVRDHYPQVGFVEKPEYDGQIGVGRALRLRPAQGHREGI
jgi:hypothetical protein